MCNILSTSFLLSVPERLSGMICECCQLWKTVNNARRKGGKRALLEGVMGREGGRKTRGREGERREGERREGGREEGGREKGGRREGGRDTAQQLFDRRRHPPYLPQQQPLHT